MSWGPVEVSGPHPKCVRCGGAWQGDDDHTHVACQDGNVVVWRHQHNDVTRISIQFSPVFDVRWNCDCMVPECKGLNVIYENHDYDEQTSLYDGSPEVERFVEHNLPFTCSEADVRAVVEAGPWKYPA